MENFKILKGNKENLPLDLENDILYIATANTENSYSSIYIDGEEFVSKKYIDKLIGDIDKLLNEL